ncbi:MAG: hypothetical protein KAQ85_07105 [Thermodesulfovibrionia bacterium]|nr:hypothetical protein [Thermodesulfovibrionia bacterium]
MLSKVKAMRDLINKEFGQYFPSIKFSLIFSDLDGTFILEVRGYDQDWAHAEYMKNPDRSDLHYGEHDWSLDFKKFEEFVEALRQNDLFIINMELSEGGWFTLTITDK